MKIFVSPCATGKDAWTHQYEMLRELHRASAPALHTWVENPEEADVIFLTNEQQPNGSALETNAIARRFSSKCFVLSERWEPPFLLAGIYANAPKSLFWRGRFRSGSYALHHLDFKNPFIENYDPTTAPERNPDLLASFVGRNCHPVRASLFCHHFSRPDLLIEDSSTFDAFTHKSDAKSEQQRRYFELCLRSKFILCPRGAGPNSIRLFEALRLGIAPVIISDDWIPCEGPEWDRFAIFVKEAELGRLESVLTHAEPHFRERGERARQAWVSFFSPPAYFNFLVASALSIQRARVIPERCFIALWPAQRLWKKIVRRTQKLAHAN